jgi:hypothetical protein
VRDGLANDRQQPERDEPGGDGDGRESGADVHDVVARVEDQAREQEAEQPDRDENRIARVDERHCG